jgi:hypothetical protein
MPDASQFNTDRTHPGRWTITFSNPPINMLVPATIVELGTLMTDLEADPSVKVVVFQSANPAFFIAHLNVATRGWPWRPWPEFRPRAPRLYREVRLLCSHEAGNHSHFVVGCRGSGGGSFRDRRARRLRDRQRDDPHGRAFERRVPFYGLGLRKLPKLTTAEQVMSVPPQIP